MRIMPCRTALLLILALLAAGQPLAVRASEGGDSATRSDAEDGLVSLLSAEFALQSTRADFIADAN